MIWSYRLWVLLGSICFSSPAFAVFEPAAPETKEEENVLSRLPDWLLQGSFEIQSRMESGLNGSEEALQIQRQSEIREFLYFKDLEHWRVRRAIPFLESARQILHQPEGSYIVTLNNRKIPSPESYSPEVWTSLVEFPFEISRRWGFLADADNWADWFEEIEEMKTKEFENAEGDKIRVQFEEKDKVKSLRFRFEGKHPTASGLPMNLRGEWFIEVGKEIPAEQVQVLDKGGSNSIGR